DPRRLRVDDHPVLDGRRAAGLELRDALDLDQAHAAGADGVAELRLVAEDGDLDVAELCGVDEHRVLRRAHLAAVDAEGDLADLGARHQAGSPLAVPASAMGVPEESMWTPEAGPPTCIFSMCSS